MSKPVSFQELPVGTKIVRNTGFGALRILLIIPTPLLLTPFILRHVGAQGLGVWAILLAINNLTSLADLGFLGSLTKHVSEYFTKKDYLQLNRTLNSGLIMFFGISVLCMCGIYLGSKLLISTFFREAPISSIQLQHVIHWLAWAIGFNLLAFPFASITTGLQRLDFINLLSAANLIVTALLAALFLSLGMGVVGLAYAIVLAAALNLVLHIGVARYLLPQFQPSARLIRMEDIKSLFSFSLQMYVTQVALAVHANTEKFLLAHFSGLGPVGWYDIANDLAGKMRSLPSLFLTPLLPATAELAARQDELKQRELYYRTHKYLAFVSIPLAVLAAMMARPFVEIWLGPGFSAAGTALAIFAGVHLFNLTCAPGALIFAGKGTLRPAVRASLFGILMNLIVSTALVIIFGFKGAVYGTSLSLVGATLYFLVLFHRETQYPIARLFQQYVKPLVCGGSLWMVALALPRAYSLRWAGLVTIPCIFLLLYCAGLILTRYFDAFDVQAVERFLPIPRLVRRIVLFA